MADKDWMREASEEIVAREMGMVPKVDMVGVAMGVTIYVTVGLAPWKASATATLVACPHVGDRIEVQERTIICERVTITGDKVYVEQVLMFASEEAAKGYFR